jgi:hypothetical protein
MNVEIGAEAPQFPEKEYISGIAFAVLHFAKLRHTEGFTNVNAFIQLCLTSTLFCKINKTDANPNMTFEHPNTIFHHARGKHKQPSTFGIVSTTFIPGKKSS